MTQSLEPLVTFGFMKRLLAICRPPFILYLCLHIVLFLLGIVLVQLGGTIWVGAGSSLIAAAITGWVIFIYVFQVQTVAERLSLFTKFGLKDAFESRSVSIKKEYSDRLSSAHVGIDIIGFGLRALREDYAQVFSDWAEKATVRLLLLDPEYPANGGSYADQRDIEENNASKTISNDVREFVRTAAPHLQRSSRFQVRLYTCLPSIRNDR